MRCIIVGTRHTHSTLSRSIRRRRLFGVEAVHPDDACPGKQRECCADKGCVVIERSGVQHHAAARHVEKIDEPVEPVSHDRLAMIDDQLGPSGRSAARHRLPLRGGKIGGQVDVLERPIRRARPDLGHAFNGLLAFADQHPGGGDLDDLRKLAPGQLRRQDARRRSRAPGSERADMMFDAVGQGDRGSTICFTTNARIWSACDCPVRGAATPLPTPRGLGIGTCRADLCSSDQRHGRQPDRGRDIVSVEPEGGRRTAERPCIC